MKTIRCVLSLFLLILLLVSCNDGGGGSVTTKIGTDTDVTGKSVMTVDNDTKGKLKEENGGTSCADMSARGDRPLFKINSYMVSGSANFSTHVKYLGELRSRSARFGLVLNSESDTDSVNKLMRAVNFDAKGAGTMLRRYCTPMWICFYATPSVTAENTGKYGDKACWYAPDYGIYDPMWRDAAKYMGEKGYHSIYEVWNEPDQPDYMWYSGWDAFIEHYIHTAGAIREGDPLAFVGGPAMSSQTLVPKADMEKFVKTVNASGTALDFFSMHYYENDPNFTLDQIISNIEDVLPENKTAQIIFTEFNTHCPAASEWDCREGERTDFTLQKASAAAKGMTALKTVLSYNDVTELEWANLFSNNGSLSLVDGKGNRSPLFHALDFYAHMPVESVMTDMSGSENVLAFASCGSTEGDIMLWNNGNAATKLSFGINNIPFEKYTADVYRIDSKHSSYLESESGSDELELVTRLENSSSGNLLWDGIIPAGGIVCIRLSTGEKNPLDVPNEIGGLIRSDRYYEVRGDGSYSDYDGKTSTAFIGLGDDGKRAAAFAAYSDVPDVLKVSTKRLNPEKADYCVLRVDYHTADGYKNSVAYLLSGEENAVIPYGTGKNADKKLTVGDEFEIDVRGNAPENWDGIVSVAFDIGGNGGNAEAIFTLERK